MPATDTALGTAFRNRIHSIYSILTPKVAIESAYKLNRRKAKFLMIPKTKESEIPCK